MDPKTLVILNLVGMGLNLVGLLLLFRFGLPFKLRTGGADLMAWDGENVAEKKLEARYDKLAWLGLGSAIVGSLVQASVTAVQGGLL